MKYGLLVTLKTLETLLKKRKRMYRKLKVVPFHVIKGNYKAVADGVCGAGLDVQKTYTLY